jgi:hypothetical protein
MKMNDSQFRMDKVEVLWLFFNILLINFKNFPLKNLLWSL